MNINRNNQIELFGYPIAGYDPQTNRIAIFLRNYPFEIFEPLKEEFEKKRWELLKEEGEDRRRRKGRESEQERLEFHEENGELVPTEKTLEILERESKAGRQPIDFYGCLKLFTVCTLKGITRVTDIYQEMEDNPVYARECFRGKTPSYATLARFDRLMGKFGLWGEYRRVCAKINLEKGINKIDHRLIVDTTHSKGNGKVGRKVKKCRECHNGDVKLDCVKCEGGKPCNEPELTCDMTGIVHKNKGNVSKGIKYQISDSSVELPFGITAFNGSKHDGSESFEEHLLQLKEEYADYLGQIREIYADGIYNNKNNRKIVKEIFGKNVRLMSKPNSGKRKAKKLERRGVEFNIGKDGKVECEEGKEFTFSTRELSHDRYIFSVANYQDCLVCEKKEQCCPDSLTGKTLRIPRELLGLYNWEEPECGKRYQKKFNIRTGIERTIGRGKEILGFARQYKRGKVNVQAFGDRIVGMMNQIAYVAYALGKPEKMLSVRYFWCS